MIPTQVEMCQSPKYCLPGTVAYLCFVIFLAHNRCTSQTGWEILAGGARVDLSPRCVAVIDSTHAVIAGVTGYIFKTTDGGTHWSKSRSGTDADLEGICFVDRDHGTIVGNSSTILRTVDGGTTWRKQENGPFGSYTQFLTVAFSDSETGVAAGWYGKVFHTSDGGESWTRSEITISQGYPRRVRLRGLHGTMVGTNGSIYRTTDGGGSWFAQPSHSTLQLYDVWMAETLRAIAVGDWGLILRTVDDGTTWNQVPLGTYDHLRSVVFYDSLEGIIGALNGSIFRTVDGGITWSGPSATPMNSVDDLSFAGSGCGMGITRNDGNIFMTEDGGESWTRMDYSWLGSYFGVSTISPDSVCAVGEGGRIVFSHDGGNEWEEQPAPTGATLRGVEFYDSKTGWIVGDSGVILHTTDAGLTWDRQESRTDRTLHAVSFPDSHTGAVVGEDNTILRTTDAGSTWTSRTGDIVDDWSAVSFIDAGHGAVAGSGGALIATSDGGSTWDLIYRAVNLYGVDVIDRDVMLAVGHLGSYPQMNLIRTTDGGINWIPGTFELWSPRGISFAAMNFGCVVGQKGNVFVTQDSGNTGINRSPAIHTLNAVSMAGPRAAFTAGDSGIIQKMLTPGDIGGVVYDDRNQDGVKNADERGRAGWKVYIDGPVRDSLTTDTEGRYLFGSLPYGSYRIRHEVRRFFDETTLSNAGFTPGMISYQHEHVTDHDFGITGPHVRLRIPVYVSDNTAFGHRYLWCGIRPGATFGIWGVDSGTSVADSIEGEHEIPPRSFAESIGLFDARFTDPRQPLNTYSTRFGEGSWTDARPYVSFTQKDTFLLSFLPGYYYGGGYPITLRWPHGVVSQSFGGPVSLMANGGGLVTDMKSVDSLTITDPAISSLFLISQSPVFPNDCLPKWRVVSLPAPVGDGSIRSLFPSATSRAYSFVPGIGFEVHDTLHPNTGYWLKYAPGLDNLAYDPAARPRDTVSVSAGWNLIGSLSVPVDVNSVTTDPADLKLGYFFGFESGYSVADSLLPGKAYWVRSDWEGRIILDPETRAGPLKILARSGLRRTLNESGEIRFTDASANSASLFLSDRDGTDRSAGFLPPFPPAGGFDVRYRTDRFVETSGEGQLTGHPVWISSADFPLAITLSRSPSSAVSVRYAGEIIPLEQGRPITIDDKWSLQMNDTDRRVVLTVILTGQSGSPASYALFQNYPNPFNPTTLIPYSLPVPSRVKLSIYDLIGRLVLVLVDEAQNAGTRSVSWNARNVASGMYYCRMEAAALDDPGRSFSGVRKLAVVR
ncbi:MAG TPA: YCF48-related protein [Bacteroidota bacterium]|nr:YCF48-related protein [Bacteroidota bacterium]